MTLVSDLLQPPTFARTAGFVCNQRCHVLSAPENIANTDKKYFTDQQMVVFVCFCPVYLTCSGATLVVRLRGVSVANHILLFGIFRFSDCIKYSWQAGKKASSFNYAKQKGASKPKNEWINGIQTKMNKNCYSAD